MWITFEKLARCIVTWSTTSCDWEGLISPRWNSRDTTDRTLLHLKDNSDESFFLINCIEYFTTIVNYCASLVVFASQKINDDPHPVVLCVTANTSALNWTLDTSKKSRIGWALARFFCGLLIGSNVGINAKWISTVENIIADKISRLKKLTSTDSKSHPSHNTYGYANLQQEHKELKACNSFQPSHKLVSLLLEILLTGNCPDLKQILKLRPQDLGKLSIWTLQRSIASKILAAVNQDTRESSHVSWSN